MWNKDTIAKCRNAAAEGIVLLENAGNVLPLQPQKPVAVFGRTQLNYYRSGTGSGGAVKAPYLVNLIEGLKNQGGCVQPELLRIYEDWIKENPFDNGNGGWAAEPWYQREMPVSEDLAARIAKTADTGLVVIGRTAGEDKDNQAAPGSYYLVDEELQLLKTVCRHFKQVVVLLNVSNLIDMGWMQVPEIKSATKAVLYVWHGGMEGGNGVADVLYAKTTPSGKLPDTIAYQIEQYPSTEGFTAEGAIQYREDIYVGYRYFETFQPEQVQYAFGYGLSYTRFSITPLEAVFDGNQITLSVQVTNTGATYAGKETVQLYYESPQGVLGKAARTLGGFAKTKTLAPAESQRLTIALTLAEMASYDDIGVTGYPNSYVLEAGLYRIYLGNSVRDAQPVSINGQEGIRLEETKLVAALEAVLSPTEPLQRLKPTAQKPDGSYEAVYEAVPLQRAPLEARIQARLPAEIPFTGNQGYQLQAVVERKISLADFTAQLTDEELATIIRGEGMSSLEVTPGTAAAFGGLSASLREYGIPVACAADGPSGIRMSADASLVPIGTLLAATWNSALVEDLYDSIGAEMRKNKVDVLLGPGMNIHRNFEYFSEDPLVTGKMASAMVKGLAKHGAIATLKHFACNNREHDRHRVNAMVSERALREIYLKGFEIAVKEGGARAVMTAYNPINGHFTASNYDLNTTVLRKEWGFSGMVMTDWWASVNDVREGGQPNSICLSHMVTAQNDLYMVVENYGAAINVNEDNILSALAEGTLTRGELQRSVMNILTLLTDTFAYAEHNFYQSLAPDMQPMADFSGEPVVVSTAQPEVSVCDKTHIHIQVEEAGIYHLILVYRLNKPTVAQSRGALLITPREPSLFLLNGSAGAEKEKFLFKGRFSAGVYQMAVAAFDDAIEFVKLRFEKH